MRERRVQSLDRHGTIEQIDPQTRPKILCTPLLESRSCSGTGRRDFPGPSLLRVYAGSNQYGSVTGKVVRINSGSGGWVLFWVGYIKYN